MTTKAVYSEIPKNTKGTAKRLMKLLTLQKGKFFVIVFSAINYCLLLTAYPLLVGWGIDQLVAALKSGQASWSLVIEQLKAPILWLIIVTVLISLFSLLQEFTMASVSETLTLTLRKRVTDKLTKVPMAYFDQQKVGTILTRVTIDLDKVSEVLQVGLMQLITASISIVLGIGIMLYLNAGLTIVVLIIFALSSWLTKILAEKNQLLFSKNQATTGNLGTKVEELYTGNQIIKAFNKQGAVIDEVNGLIDEQAEAFKKAQFVSFAVTPLIRFVNQLGFVISATVGGFLVIQGSLTIGAVQAYLQYINQVSEPMTQASYIINSLQSAIAAVERIFEVLDAPEEASETNLPMLPEAVIGGIEFDQVSFGYVPEKLIMKDVSFTVKPRATVAIVGPTGAGKTTLINLLMRFYNLSSGQILLDNQNIATHQRSSIRQKIGMVLQDTWLFEGTIAANIAYGKQNASRAEIVAAAQAAKCHHFIQTLPDGYDTIISSDSSEISQGQQQLLTIARAMLANPSIMILDEATSSVDTRTEIEIQTAMNQLTQDKTSFVIAHRLSTIKNADLILVMKDGTIIEKGTHQELLAQEAFYSQLYNSQFQ